MTNKAYKSGYEMAKSYLMDNDTKGLHKHMIEMHDFDAYFEGMTSAIYDFENGIDWEF